VIAPGTVVAGAGQHEPPLTIVELVGQTGPQLVGQTGPQLGAHVGEQTIR
jgi:hypothetical protein